MVPGVIPESNKRRRNSKKTALCCYFPGRNEPIYPLCNHCPNDINNKAISNPDDHKFSRKKGQIVLDQIRTVDKQRLVKKLSSINEKTQNKVFSALTDIFTR
jgi:hypothetical protein